MDFRSDMTTATQTRCPNCLNTHPVMAVLEISDGGIRCGGCEAISVKLTVAEYDAAIRAAKAAEGKAAVE